MGEVDIYNGDYELGYLAINGAVKKQKYTYFLYESNDREHQGISLRTALTRTSTASPRP